MRGGYDISVNQKTRRRRQSATGETQPDVSADCVLSKHILADSSPKRMGESVANVLCREKQIAVLRLLSEGNSIRSSERLTGVHRDTIMRLTIRFGNNCRAFLDDALMNLKLQHVQCDEIWTFCRMKEGQAKQRNLDTTVIGDQYLYTALDTDTKLLVTFAIGKRGWETTNAFIRDLRK